MTTPNVRSEVLGKVAADFNRANQLTDSPELRKIIRRQSIALKVAVERCAKDGYTTWDTSMVPEVDGKYDPVEAEKWEKAHGHDIRLKCYPEFGCQLLIDPEDLLTEIAKEMGING